MYTCHFYLYGTCKDFVKSSSQYPYFIKIFTKKTSIKDALASMGIPHPEVGSHYTRLLQVIRSLDPAYTGK